MKSIVLTAALTLFAAQIFAQSPSVDKENHGTAVSAVATEKSADHGQAVKAATPKERLEQVNDRADKLAKEKADKVIKDKADKTDKVEKAFKAEKTDKVDKAEKLKDDQLAEKKDNHGQTVSSVAKETELTGNEKGQAVRAAASSKNESDGDAVEKADKPAKADKLVKADKTAKADKPAKADKVNKPAHEAKNKPAHQNNRGGNHHHAGGKGK
jgi:hypothetical protein